MKDLISSSLSVLVAMFLVHPLAGEVRLVPPGNNPQQYAFRGFGSPHVGVFPIAPQERSRAWFMGGFFHRSGYLHIGRQPYDFPSYYPFGWSYRGVPKNYSSAYFVQTWKDRDPLKQPVEQDFEHSILLSQGMDTAAVMKRLGSPIQRIRLGPRELWRYSSYSLLFEAGALMEIR